MDNSKASFLLNGVQVHWVTSWTPRCIKLQVGAMTLPTSLILGPAATWGPGSWSTQGRWQGREAKQHQARTLTPSTHVLPVHSTGHGESQSPAQSQGDSKVSTYLEAQQSHSTKRLQGNYRERVTSLHDNQIYPHTILRSAQFIWARPPADSLSFPTTGRWKQAKRTWAAGQTRSLAGRWVGCRRDPFIGRQVSGTRERSIHWLAGECDVGEIHPLASRWPFSYFFSLSGIALMIEP